MPTNSQSLIPNPPARRERDIKRLARNLTQAFAPAGRVLRRTARDPIGAIITALEPPSPKGLRATALLAGEMLPGAGIFDSGQYGRKSAEALKKGDYGISLAEMLTGMGMAATEYPLLKGAKPAIKKAGQWMTDMLRNLSPQQTGELNALVEAGHTTAGALQKIAEQGMEADLTRRQLLRLGGDASKAATVATHTPRMPEIITSNYPEVSARRIVDATRPILKKAEPIYQPYGIESTSKFSDDLHSYALEMRDDYKIPNFEQRIDEHLLKTLRTKAELDEARAVLSAVPDHSYSASAMVADGRPKELWRSGLGEYETMPDLSRPKFMRDDTVLSDDQLRNLSRTYDEWIDEKVDRLEDMAHEFAEDNMSIEEHAKFFEGDVAPEWLLEQPAAVQDLLASQQPFKNEWMLDDIAQDLPQPTQELVAQGKDFNPAPKLIADSPVPQKTSMMEEFGSQEMNDIADIGIKLQEKPGYLSEITTGMSSSQIPDVEKAIGYKLNSYNLADVVKKHGKKTPTSSYATRHFVADALKNDDQMFILWDPETKARYLVDRTGASSYIRNWTKID